MILGKRIIRVILSRESYLCIYPLQTKRYVFWTRILANLFHHWCNNYCSMYESLGKAEGTQQTVAVSSSRNRRWRHTGNNFTGKHNETKKISSRTRLLLIRYFLRSWIHFFFQRCFQYGTKPKLFGSAVYCGMLLLLLYVVWSTLIFKKNYLLYFDQTSKLYNIQC